ncbi:Rab family GTPase [Aspergillus melleus]|uniref:Rab family GTPase n=1 Tax=Aspergillus melleus TaxID=138277 RepID=UPI001E8DE845|nr:GTPase Ryh1 [Aspergillus melleus]KAH8432798.1 GTPase Ryh1 [Aspergillus melleus]
MSKNRRSLSAAKVGKTSLIARFQKDQFDVSVLETVAMDLIILNISLSEQALRLAICDCSGKDRYWYLVPQFTRDAPVIVAVYDVTSEKSLDEALRMIKGQVEQAKVKSMVFLVGNKTDQEGGRKVSAPAGEEAAKARGYVFVETSAMTGENVRWLFEEITRRHLESEKGGKSFET